MYHLYLKVQTVHRLIMVSFLHFQSVLTTAWIAQIQRPANVTGVLTAMGSLMMVGVLVSSIGSSLI